jgi:hypothetical protein
VDQRDEQRTTPAPQWERNIGPYRWQPGQSGNPSGRPKQVPILELFEKSLRKLADQRGLPMEDAWEIFSDALVLACIGDRCAPIMRDIVARRDGPVPQEVDMRVGVPELLERAYQRWLVKDEPQPQPQLEPHDADDRPTPDE